MLPAPIDIKINQEPVYEQREEEVFPEPIDKKINPDRDYEQREDGTK